MLCTYVKAVLFQQADFEMSMTSQMQGRQTEKPTAEQESRRLWLPELAIRSVHLGAQLRRDSAVAIRRRGNFSPLHRSR
jgi:hypothetical protein